MKDKDSKEVLERRGNMENENNEIEIVRDVLKKTLNGIAKPMEIIDFTRENYNNLFPCSQLQSPIEVIRLGEHQFEKLDAKERQTILKAVYDVLKTPDIVINEKRQTVFGDLKPAHVYAKSFEQEGKNKAVQSVVVSIESENVSISTHQRDINNVVNKIKMPDQLIYISTEVGQMIERLTGMSVTVNPTRVNIVPPSISISQLQEKTTETEYLVKENARLKEENLRLGKQIFEYQKEKLLSQKASVNKNNTKSKEPKDKAYGYER